jgi:hypothetical protein
VSSYYSSKAVKCRSGFSESVICRNCSYKIETQNFAYETSAGFIFLLFFFFFFFFFFLWGRRNPA